VTSETTRRWIEVGKRLATDPNAVVGCPECDDGVLLAEDVVFTSDPTRMERLITCSKCGAKNAIRMSVPKRRE